MPYDLFFEENLEKDHDVLIPIALPSLVQRLVDAIQPIAQQPNSIPALFHHRQAQQQIDNMIQQQGDNEEFMRQLFSQVLIQNNIFLLQLVEQRYERHLGKQAIKQFLTSGHADGLSLFAFAISQRCSLAVIKHLIDEIGLAAIIRQYQDDEHFAALLFLALRENDLHFLNSLKAGLEKILGEQEAFNYLVNCSNAMEQSLLAAAIENGAPLTTIQHLINVWRLPVNQAVVFTMLRNKNTQLFNYFVDRMDNPDVRKNGLLRLSNTIDAYTREYGNDPAYIRYKEQITQRLAQRNLLLVFEREAVPIIARPVPQSPTESPSDAVQKSSEKLDNKQEQLLMKVISEAEDKLVLHEREIHQQEQTKREIAHTLVQLADAKDHLLAKVTAKQTLNWSQRTRLSLASQRNWLTSVVNWFFDRMGITSLPECQQRQQAISDATQTLATTTSAVRNITQNFCRPRNQPLTLNFLQLLATEWQQKQQQAVVEHENLLRQQMEMVNHIQNLRQNTPTPPPQPTPSVVVADRVTAQTALNAPRLT